jgi:cytochrome P450
MSFQEPLSFDPMDANFCRDFYPNIKRMRETHRAYRHPDTLSPVVSFFRYADVAPMLANWHEWSSERSEEKKARGLGVASIMLGNDPPLHTRYRKIMAPFFMPKSIQTYEAIIESLIDEAVEACVGTGDTDFVEKFADHVTVGLICEICGIPAEDREMIRAKAMLVAENYGKGLFWKEENPEIEAMIAKVSWDFGFYFIQHVERLKTSGQNSILGRMAEHLDNPREIAAMCALIIAGGVETTTNNIVHGLQELIRHPDQFALLRRQPELLDSAIEEMVRYRGTLRRQERVAMRDVDIDGIAIAKGDTVVLWNASACRDPDFIDRPEIFDITRKPNKHIGYGNGIHMCIGNVLARAELRSIFGRLLSATSHIEEARGADSYQDAGNGVMDVARRYSLIMHA